MSAVRMIDAAPLVAIVEERGGLSALGLGRRDAPHLRRAYYRAKATGSISWTSADALAVKVMGRHPSVVFGRAWWSL